jgi:hypothetical protein
MINAMQSLIISERDEYIGLVNRFVAAKENGDYAKSDILRKELIQWQELPDSDFIK